jgi:outer membrane protein assembly factor BamB
MRTGLCALLVASSCWSIVWESSASAAEWARFRGPNGVGIASGKDIPIEWSDKDGILWKVPIGPGNSSPVVWGNRVFLQSASADGKERRLLCLNVADGRIMWSEQVPGNRVRTHNKNSLASSTPATDGERVYAMFWDGQEMFVYAYDFKGQLVWKRALGSHKSQHGAGVSPMVYRDKVILANDQDGSSVLVAMEAKTGKIAWQVERPAFRACYSTPFLLDQPGQPIELIVGSTAGVASYQPDTGSVNWNWTWRFSGDPLRTVSSPIFNQGMIFANSGDGKGDRHTVAIKAGGTGDVTKNNFVWENKRVFPYVPCMLAWGDHIYFVNDKGIAACHVAKTGAEVWSERLGNADVTASPVLIDGKIYAINEAGTVFVFPAATTFKLLGKTSMGEGVMATPAVADNRLFIRGKNNLFCIGKTPVR